MKFAATLLLSAFVSCKDMFSHGELRIAPGGLEALSDEFKDWWASDQEQDKAQTSHIKMVEDAKYGNPSLVFVNDQGEDLETVFVSYIPLSMVKDLIKDKEWAEASKEDL